MQIPISLVCLLISLKSIGQIVVENTSPEVSMDRRLVVYIGIDNPITITTGGDNTAKVSVKNGILTSAGANGKYWLRPLPDYEWNSPIIVTVKTSKQERDFSFDILSLPNPEIKFGGSRNEDNVIDNFRHHSKGVFCYIKYFELPALFRVDSFIVSIEHPKDSTGFFTHTNKGAAWDSITSNKILTAKAKSFVRIQKAWITGPDGRQFIQNPDLAGYIE